MRVAQEAIIPLRLHKLLAFLMENNKIAALTARVGPELLKYWTTEIRKMMDSGDEQWKSLVPAELVPLYEQQLLTADD